MCIRVLSVSVQRKSAEMFCRSGLVISHEEGLHFDAGFAVSVLISSCCTNMGHVEWLFCLCSGDVRLGGQRWPPWCMGFLMNVLHGESYTRLALPGNTTRQRTPHCHSERLSISTNKVQAGGTTGKGSSLVKSGNTHQHSVPARCKHSKP